MLSPVEDGDAVKKRISSENSDDEWAGETLMGRTPTVGMGTKEKIAESYVRHLGM